MPGKKPMAGAIDTLFEPDFSLASLYHLNTKLVRSLRSRTLTAEQQARGVRGEHVKQYLVTPRVSLPSPSADADPTMSLAQALRARESTRAWQNKAISLEQLATVLQLGAGIVREEELHGKPAYYRSAPSGGSHYPIEIYPIVFNVGGLEKGIYHYNPIKNGLDVLQLDEETERVIQKTISSPEMLEGACVVFLLTAIFERTTLQYADRGYRYVLLEAGHIAQNLCLIATGLGLGSLCMAEFYEQDIEQLLWLDGFSESLIYAVVVGAKAD